MCELGIGLLHFGGVHQRKRVLAVGGGFLEVANDRVTVLADTAELPEEIDVSRARAAAGRAQARLRSRDGNIDHARAQVALQKALNRLRAAGALDERAH